MTDKLKELINKVQKLSIEGVAGEKENAIKKLEYLMKKHNITEKDLINEEVLEFEIRYKDNTRAIISQIIQSYFTNTHDKYDALFVYTKSKKKVFIVKCTQENFLEVEFRIKLYVDSYLKQFDIFYEAFVYKNKLGTKPKEDEEINLDIDLERAAKVQFMMNSIEKTNINLQIGGGVE